MNNFSTNKYIYEFYYNRKRHLIIAWIILCLFQLFFFEGCEDSISESSLGKEFFNSQASLNLIDTFSVKLSTVIFDTVVTSASGSILIGNYQDNLCGKISSKSFMELGFPDEFNIANDDEYDSLVLVLTFNDYIFGNSANPQKIVAYRLNENIETNDEEKITSNTSFAYNPYPIGSITYIPESKNPGDSLVIKIDDEIGKDLFTKFQNASDLLFEGESFSDYLHGIVLIVDDAYTGNIVGFKANTNEVKLVLYSSRQSYDFETITHEFKLVDTKKQFNNIEHDFTSTQLSNLIEQEYELPSSKSGGFSVLQGGIGLAIKVEFPSLSDILLFEKGSIIEAQLCLTPLSGSYKDISLPSSLIMYKSDRQNKRNDIVTNTSGITAYSNLKQDDFYYEDTEYQLDLTQYINDEFSNRYFDPENSILLSLSSEKYQSTFSRLILDPKNKKTKLKIYYLSF